MTISYAGKLDIWSQVLLRETVLHPLISQYMQATHGYSLTHVDKAE